MHCINNTHSHFKDNNRLPIQRFFSKDWIHLTRPSVLLDAMNRNINIVVDYTSVFNGPKYRGYSGPRYCSPEQGLLQRKSTFDRRNNQFYECAMTGHIASECKPTFFRDSAIEPLLGKAQHLLIEIHLTYFQICVISVSLLTASVMTVTLK